MIFNEMDKITRFEVIDETGRVLTRRPCRVDLSVQDNGTTLKVFVRGGKPTTPYTSRAGDLGRDV
jgi:hypothetical protein